MKNTVLIYVRDRISMVPETQIMQLATDVHAIKGFIDFCKKDHIAKEEHELVKIGELNEENHLVYDWLENDKEIKEKVLCNGNTAERIYKELTVNLREDSDLEE